MSYRKTFGEGWQIPKSAKKKKEEEEETRMNELHIKKTRNDCKIEKKKHFQAGSMSSGSWISE